MREPSETETNERQKASSEDQTPRRSLQDNPESDDIDLTADPAKQLLLGLAFGVIFGFLLQKGGVAKYHVLIGVLLLEDFTVIKVMVSAIILGMAGVFVLRGLGQVRLHLKPTRYGANIIGGLLFGIGFAMLGYCPGTGAAAFGQGNYDALFGIAGMMAGSFVFAKLSGRLNDSVAQWADRGKLTLPEVAHIPLRTFVVLFVPFLIGCLAILELVAAHR